MTTGATLFTLYSSKLTNLYWKVTRNAMDHINPYPHAGAVRIIGSPADGKHSLTLRRGRYIAKRKEIYKLHSRSYRTSRALTRTSNPSWQSLRDGGTFGRTVKLQVDGRLVTDCEEETETALRHGIFFA